MLFSYYCDKFKLGSEVSQSLLRTTANCNARTHVRATILILIKVTAKILLQLCGQSHRPKVHYKSICSKVPKLAQRRTSRGISLNYENRVPELALHSWSGAQTAMVGISAFVSVVWGKHLPKQLRIFEWTDIFPNVFFKCCSKLKVYSGPLRISLQISPRYLYVSSCFITSCSYSPKTVQGKRRNYLAGRSLRPVSWWILTSAREGIISSWKDQSFILDDYHVVCIAAWTANNYPSSPTNKAKNIKSETQVWIYSSPRTPKYVCSLKAVLMKTSTRH